MCCFYSQILSPAQLAAGSQPVQIVRSVGTNYKFPAPSPYRKPGPQRHGYKQEVFDGGQFSCFRIFIIVYCHYKMVVQIHVLITL